MAVGEERTIVERTLPFARKEAPSPVGGEVWRMQDRARMQDSSRAGETSRTPDTTPADGAVEVIGRLAAESAHELNNQISVILNYTFILLRQLPEDSPLREHIPEMQSAAWRASAVAQEMLAFGGPRIAEAEPLDLHAVIMGMKPLLAQALQQSAVLEVRTVDQLDAVQARQPHLEWLLLELALHARRVLGQVERFSLELRNDDEGAPAVRLTATAQAPRTPAGEAGHAPASVIPRAFPEEASRLPGADLTLTHTQGTLTTHRDDEHSVRYELRLPALR